MASSSSSLNNSVKINQIIRVSPPANSTTELTLPLTFFDILMLNLPPVETLFFYHLPDLTLHSFNSLLLPKLINSLSLTLLHYLPLAAKLIWPPRAPKPSIHFSPLNDAVSLTVAESDADFNLLSSNRIRQAILLRPLTPQLLSSELISLQITLFPNQGFSIGVSTDHVLLDGNSITMFLKSWVYICRNQSSNLPSELIPIFDRTLIDDPDGTDMDLIENWLQLNSNSRRLTRLTRVGPDSDTVRATYVLSRDDIKRLRGKISLSDDRSKRLRLSTFVVVCASVFACKVKARGRVSNDNENEDVVMGFSADCRSRLDPPVPKNYVGNCLRQCFVNAKARDLDEVCFVAEKLSDMINGLELESKFNVVKEPKETFENLIRITSDRRSLGVSWSTQFDVYELDFGWGKPEKIEIVHIDGDGSVSMIQSRDSQGGVEVGVALDELEMEAFHSLFVHLMRD